MYNPDTYRKNIHYVLNSLSFLMALRFFCRIKKKIKQQPTLGWVWDEAKFKSFTNILGDLVVTLLSLSLSLTENCYLWFWVVSGELPSAQELNLSKPFLAQKSHEFWLLTRLYYPLALAEMKIFLEKEIFQHPCASGLSWSQHIQRKAE